jgi:short-subunit dehydrogenase
VPDHVLITGGACDVGQATALACAEAGYQVIITMRRVQPLRALERLAAERGLGIHIEQLDVSGNGAAAKIRELVLKYGPLYGLVNNAAVAVSGPFEEQSERDVWSQFETNVLGLMNVTRAVLPTMRASERGRIINVSSISGRLALPGLSTYAAATHAIEGLSEALRMELSPFGVAVCLVEAGSVKPSVLLGKCRAAEHAREDSPYARMIEQVEKAVLQSAERDPSAEAVASAVLRLLRGPTPPYRTVVGLNARTMLAMRKVIPDSLFADGVRRYIGLKPASSRSR